MFILKECLVQKSRTSKGSEYQDCDIVRAGSLSWLTGTTTWSRSIIDIISYTWALPATVTQVKMCAFIKVGWKSSQVKDI